MSAKIHDFCSVTHLHTEWKCPRCKTNDGICDHGSVVNGDQIEFHCFECDLEEVYAIEANLKLIKC